MITYSVTISEAEELALKSIAFQPEEWISNVVHERSRVAIEEIVAITVEKCLATATPIPGSKDEIVKLAFEKGWVSTIKDLTEQAQSNVPGQG